MCAPSREEQRKGKDDYLVKTEHKCTEAEIRKKNSHLQSVDILIFGHDQGISGETGRSLAETKLQAGIRDIAGEMDTGQPVEVFRKGKGKGKDGKDKGKGKGKSNACFDFEKTGYCAKGD